MKNSTANQHEPSRITNYRLQTAVLRITALSRKELFSWANSPALYGIAVFFLLFVSIWFYHLQRFFAMDIATLRPFFAAFPLAFILVIPVLTMRAWAEEKKLGSAEILFTLPFTEWELVLGKFLSCFTMLFGMMLLTLPVPVTLLPLGYFDPGVIFAEYLGALLLGASTIAIGLFLSGVSKNQAAAFLGSAVVLLVVILVNNFSQNLPSGIASFTNFISLSFHFESFSRGLLDSRDIVFFLLTTMLFLSLNTQVLVFRKWDRAASNFSGKARTQARIIAVLSAVVILLAFLLSTKLWSRFDLTKNKAYTISEVSKKLYREISDEVSVTYFVSDKLRQAHPMPGEIADLLSEYASHSRGKIRFIQKDPAKAELLQKVEDLGIMPQQIQVMEKNETILATVYSGILIEYLNRESVIPVVFSLDTLEYDLSSRIRALVSNRERELGVIVGDAHKQWASEYGLLHRELLLAGFHVRLLGMGEEINPMLPALFVLGGSGDLEMDALYHIDRYVQSGGNVFFAADAIAVDTRGGLEARPVEDKGLLALLANYGVILHRAMVLDRNALGLTFQSQSGYGTVLRTIRYPLWISVQENSGNKNHPLGARFRGLDLYWASPLELNQPEGVQAEVLFTSSADAWLQTEKFVTNPNFISQFADERESTSGAKILGAALTGIFPSVFENETGNLNMPAFVSGKSSRIIVVGDTDFAGSLMQVNRGEDRNLDFLLRAAEWLSSDDDIITIRSREDSGRLDRITDRDTRDAAMGLSRLLNTVFVPFMVIMAGFFIVNRRKKATAKKGESK